MKKILISSCLLGKKVRYDGSGELITSKTLNRWHKEGRLILVCPEVMGGLPVPRSPAEIVGKGGGLAVINKQAKIINKNGIDVSHAFQMGASAVLDLVKKHDIEIAILKENSPSCGSNKIYDGSFKGKKINGAGLTTALLEQFNVKVFSENEIQKADTYLNQLKNRPFSR